MVGGVPLACGFEVYSTSHALAWRGVDDILRGDEEMEWNGRTY